MLTEYLLFINSASFLLFGLDKYRARRNLYRISEKTLFLFAIAGGAAGALLGMYLFHHKTRHRSFVWGLPLILLVQILLTTYNIYR